ncbi:hypothetical protein WJX74_007486 [Apatococcus lobatus]|uniref:Uncharacterized protein n=2 Tax=Apatococcus TaxID=904362 RepID=A0AAW1T7L6_9CHLO
MIKQLTHQVAVLEESSARKDTEIADLQQQATRLESKEAKANQASSAALCGGDNMKMNMVGDKAQLEYLKNQLQIEKRHNEEREDSSFN